MACLWFNESAAVQRSALTPTGPSRDHDRGSAPLLTGSHDADAGWSGKHAQILRLLVTVPRSTAGSG